MKRIRQSPLYGALAFLFIFATTKWLCELLWGAQAAFFGIDGLKLSLLLLDNQMILQLFCLSTSLLLTGWILDGKTELLNSIRTPLSWGLSRIGTYAQVFWNGAFRGFLVASAFVAVSIFLGFSTLEGPRLQSLRIADLFELAYLFQVIEFVLWLWAVEGARNFLWNQLKIDTQTFHESQLRSSLKRLIVVSFEASLIFGLFNASDAPLEKAFVALVSLLIAAAGTLWFELHRHQKIPHMLSLAKRLGLLCGVGVSLFHSYGQALGASRRASILHLFPGSVLDPTKIIAVQGALGQCLFILVLVYFINRLTKQSLTS
jgi:hypothetical protein